MKQCSICDKSLPFSSFPNDFTRKDNRQSVCKGCKKMYDKAKRKILREYVNHYLSTHPCVDCGEKRMTTLEFDHRDGRTEKENSVPVIIGASSSWKRLQQEIDKCDVRCASCHAHKHRKDVEHYKWKELNH